MPNAASLASEYVPRRERPFAVTLTIVCIPLGGFVASTMARVLGEALGWQGLFIAGGMIPVVLGIVLFKALPESPRYLASHRERWPELTRALRKMGNDVPDDAVYAEASPSAAAAAVKKATLGDLFAPAFARDTIGLFGAFFFCLMVNYVAILLVPSMLQTQGGFTPPQAASGLQWVNVGGVIGAIAGALIIQRIGSRVTMLGMSVAAVLFSFAMSRMRLDPNDTFALMAMFLITGGLLNAVQTTMYALAAHVYPTQIRSTGVGAAVAFGRIGNVLAAPVGGWSLDQGGVAGYFICWAVLMALVFISLAIVKNHIGKSASEPVLAAH
jgi:AAHS family 4-hydroxybenzoate transporter-like MFS transporter